MSRYKWHGGINVTPLVFVCGCSSGWISDWRSAVPLTLKLTSHYKADYVKLRGTLLDPFSPGTDSHSFCCPDNQEDWISHRANSELNASLTPLHPDHISFPDKSIRVSPWDPLCTHTGSRQTNGLIRDTNLILIERESFPCCKLSRCTEQANLFPALCYDRLGTHSCRFSQAEIWYHVRNSDRNLSSGWHVASSGGQRATPHAWGAHTDLQGSP